MARIMPWTVTGSPQLLFTVFSLEMASRISSRASVKPEKMSSSRAMWRLIMSWSTFSRISGGSAITRRMLETAPCVIPRAPASFTSEMPGFLVRKVSMPRATSTGLRSARLRFSSIAITNISSSDSLSTSTGMVAHFSWSFLASFR